MEITQQPEARENLYQALLGRRSVRRYERRPLPEETLAYIRECIEHAVPLVPENRVSVLMRDVMAADDLVEALGGYGRILSAPHFMVPTIVGSAHPLKDLGYRAQQAVVAMVQLGLGACYIGSLGREPTLRVRFLLKREVRIGAVVIFGFPAMAWSDRSINAAMRTAMGSTQRLPVDQIFFEGAFSSPGMPPSYLVPLIEAARQAPSALNVQPWRFLWKDGQLTLFVQRANPKYGKDLKQDYRLFDVGICMANVMLAMRALNMPGKWVLLGESDREVPLHPDTLEPIATLELGY